MKPYYEDATSGITIYHGDALDVLAELSIDLHADAWGRRYKTAARARCASPIVYDDAFGWLHEDAPDGQTFRHNVEVR